MLASWLDVCKSELDTACILLYDSEMERLEWQVLMREARTAAGLSRAGLARLSGVGAATIKAYELGLRKPSQLLLTTLLAGLEADRYVRNRVLEGAGYKPDGLDVWRRNPEFALSFAEALAEIEKCRWPAMLTDERMKVLASNAAYERLWGREGRSGQGTEGGGSFLSWMSYPPFADRLSNWDEVMGFLISEMKGNVRFPEKAEEGTDSYVTAALERFFSGDPGYIARDLALWERTPAALAKARFSYRIAFDHLTFGPLSFRCLGMGVNELDGLILNDWIPEDSETWARLEQGGVVRLSP